nr:TadE/TadG family type IV pilus assembly protein [uncultured Cohaesibacter sp.]
MTILSAIRSHLRHFRKDERGVSAIEFVLVVPLMALIAIGSWEITKAMLTKRKVAHLASSIANLAAQDDNITSSDWTTFQDIADKILYPYNSFTRRIGLLVVEVDSSGRINTLCQFGTASIDPSTLPTGLQIANTTYLMSASEVDYVAFSKDNSFYGITPGISDMTFRDTAIFAPRNADTITCN